MAFSLYLKRKFVFFFLFPFFPSWSFDNFMTFFQNEQKKKIKNKKESLNSSYIFVKSLYLIDFFFAPFLFKFIFTPVAVVTCSTYTGNSEHHKNKKNTRYFSSSILIEIQVHNKGIKLLK